MMLGSDKLKPFFPETCNSILQNVTTTSSTDQAAALYRLLEREGGRDPFHIIYRTSNDEEILSKVRSQQAGAANLQQQLLQQQMQHDVLLQQQLQHHQQKFPQTGRNSISQGGSETVHCPACCKELTFEHQRYPFKLNCANCKTLFRLSSPVKRRPVSHNQWPNDPRADWPSCDYCGQQFSSMAERAEHTAAYHQREEEELKKQLELLSTAPRQLERKTREFVVMTWQKILEAHVLPRMDDIESYRRKLEAASQTEQLVKGLFPEAMVYLFGSTSSGASEKKSDTDLAVRLGENMDPKQVDDVAVIEALYGFFNKEQMFPWPEGGLRKVTKTRVPILGNYPLSPEEVDEEEEGHAKYRTLTLQVCDPMRLSIHEVQNLLLVEQQRLSKHLPSDAKTELIIPEGKLRVVTPTQQGAIALKLKEHKFVLSAPPLVFRTTWDLSLKFYGVRNSALLRQYLDQPAFRIAACAIKIWSRKSGINDPRTGLLSSYAVIIMFVYFLVRRDHTPWIDPESIHPSKQPSKPPFKPLQIREDSTKGAAVYLLLFFDFYARSHNWDTDVITINTDTHKQKVTKASKGWTDENAVIVDRAKCVRYHICIEDPYEQADPPAKGSLNLGRKVPRHRAVRIQTTFRKAWEDCFTTSSPRPTALLG